MSSITFVVGDIKRGIKKNWLKYLFLLFFIIIVSYMMCSLSQRKLASGQIGSKPSFMDIIIYIFSGTDKFNPEKDTIFVIPPIWFGVQMFIAFIVSNYMTKDMEDNKILVIKSVSRSKWWFSKCLWNIVSVLLSYAVMYMGVFITVLMVGRNGIQPDSQICSVISKIQLETMGVNEIVFISVILPIVVSMGISMMQMLICLLTGPVISIAVIVAVNVSSVYYLNPVLLGNYTMLQRNSIFMQGGVNTYLGIIISIVLIMCCIFWGNAIFNKMDIR